jgi:hypothetical protein
MLLHYDEGDTIYSSISPYWLLEFFLPCYLHIIRNNNAYILPWSLLQKKDPYLCDNSCTWNPHEFSLAHLQEVEFKNLIGTDCELQFIQYILKRKIGVRKVHISFGPSWNRIIEDNKDAFKLMPPLDCRSSGAPWLGGEGGLFSLRPSPGNDRPPALWMPVCQRGLVLHLSSH